MRSDSPNRIGASSTPSRTSDDALRRDGTVGNPAHAASGFAVKLTWLERFAEKHHIRDRGLTTEQVVSELVKPLTGADRCRFVDLILRDIDPSQRDAVSKGRPFYFVSHSWSRPFAETLAMLSRHFSPGRQRLWRRKDGRALPVLPPDQVFLWLDVFAANQHARSGRLSAADLATLFSEVCGAVKDAEGTLMVVDPGGAVLSRIWCLYEAWQSSQAGPSRLQLLMQGLDFDMLEEAFAHLDVRSATSSLERDRTHILSDLLSSQGGLRQVTRTLKDAFIAGALAVLPPSPPERTHAAAAAAAGALADTSASDDAGVNSATAEGDAGSGGGAAAAATGWTHDVGEALNAAARLCVVYSKYDQAEPLLRRNLQGCEGVLGHDHPLSLAAADALVVLLTARRSFEEAEPLCRRAMDSWARVRGPEHPGTLAATCNLAEVLQLQRKHGEAEALLRSALTGRERVLGREHPTTLASVAQLADALRAQGRYDEAELLYRRALEGLERALGPDHASTTAVVSCLGVLFGARKRLDEAEQLLRRVLDVRQRLLGPDHPDTLTAASDLAALLRARLAPPPPPPPAMAAAAATPAPTGLVKELEALLRRVLEGREGVLGPDHVLTLATMHNLASWLASYGRYDEAEPLCRRALSGRDRVLGPEHLDTMATVRNLGLLLKTVRRYDEAEIWYRRLLHSKGQALGAQHPETLAHALGLAEVLVYSGRYGEAEALYRRALAGREQSLGAEHPDTLACLSGMAGLLALRSKHDEAEGSYRRVLAARDLALGPDHPDSLACAQSLAELLVFRGKYEDAELLCRRVLAGRERQQLPEGHPDVLSALSTLSSLLVYRGKHEEAEVLYRRALDARAQNRAVAVGAGGDAPPATPPCVSGLTNLMASCGKCSKYQGSYDKRVKTDSSAHGGAVGGGRHAAEGRSRARGGGCDSRKQAADGWNRAGSGGGRRSGDDSRSRSGSGSGSGSRSGSGGRSPSGSGGGSSPSKSPSRSPFYNFLRSLPQKTLMRQRSRTTTNHPLEPLGPRSSARCNPSRSFPSRPWSASHPGGQASPLPQDSGDAGTGAGPSGTPERVRPHRLPTRLALNGRSFTAGMPPLHDPFPQRPFPQLPQRSFPSPLVVPPASSPSGRAALLRASAWPSSGPGENPSSASASDSASSPAAAAAAAASFPNRVSSETSSPLRGCLQAATLPRRVRHPIVEARASLDQQPAAVGHRVCGRSALRQLLEQPASGLASFPPAGGRQGQGQGQPRPPVLIGVGVRLAAVGDSPTAAAATAVRQSPYGSQGAARADSNGGSTAGGVIRATVLLGAGGFPGLVQQPSQAFAGQQQQQQQPLAPQLPHPLKYPVVPPLASFLVIGGRSSGQPVASAAAN